MSTRGTETNRPRIGGQDITETVYRADGHHAWIARTGTRHTKTDNEATGRGRRHRKLSGRAVGLDPGEGHCEVARAELPSRLGRPFGRIIGSAILVNKRTVFLQNHLQIEGASRLRPFRRVHPGHDELPIGRDPKRGCRIADGTAGGFARCPGTWIAHVEVGAIHPHGVVEIGIGIGIGIGR